LGTGVIVDREQLATLCRMARRGARAAMAARLTDDVLMAASDAYSEAMDNRHQSLADGYAATRHVLLDALAGAGEETT